jgi:hypothetical protein
MNDEIKSRQISDLHYGQTVDVERRLKPSTKYDRISAYEEGVVTNIIRSYYSVDYGTDAI